MKIDKSILNMIKNSKFKILIIKQANRIMKTESAISFS